MRCLPPLSHAKVHEKSPKSDNRAQNIPIVSLMSMRTDHVQDSIAMPLQTSTDPAILLECAAEPQPKYSPEHLFYHGIDHVSPWYRIFPFGLWGKESAKELLSLLQHFVQRDCQASLSNSCVICAYQKPRSKKGILLLMTRLKTESLLYDKTVMFGNLQRILRVTLRRTGLPVRQTSRMQTLI